MSKRVDYGKLFEIPSVFQQGQPAKCLICNEKKLYGPLSKGNLLKHYQLKHPTDLKQHYETQQRNVLQSQTTIMLTNTTIGVDKEPFCRQKAVERSIAVDLCGPKKILQHHESYQSYNS